MANRAAKLGLVEYGARARKACGNDDALAERAPLLAQRAAEVRVVTMWHREFPMSPADAWALAQLLG